jgi:hypothetical protein
MEKEWKQVFLTGELYQAEMAKELLELEGVDCVVLNMKDSAIQSFGDIEIYVHENNIVRAIEILKNLKH